MKTYRVAFLLFLGFMFLVHLILAQTKTERLLDDFNAVEINLPTAVSLHKSKQTKAVLQCQDIKAEDIITEVRNKTLYISLQNKPNEVSKKWHDGFQINIQLHYSQIASISLSQAALLTSTEKLQSPTLQLNLAGASKVKLILATEKLQIDATGASSINLEGEATEIALSATGAIRLQAFGLASKKIKANIAGASNVQVAVEQSLEVEASGASKVQYKGKPTTCIVEATGVSVVKRAF